MEKSGDPETKKAKNQDSFNKCAKICRCRNKSTSNFPCDTTISGGNIKNSEVGKR